MIFVAWVLATTAVSASGATGLQAQFEQASAALVAQRWQDALADFKAIEARPGISNRTRSVVLLREGAALRQLGRDNEALETYRRGLALAPRNDPALNDDRLDSLLAAGGIERGGYDYEAARRHFEEARALAGDPASRIRVLLALASVTMFDDPQAALAQMDEAVRIAADAKVAPEVDATIRDLRGRVLLNQGNFAAALADLQIALKDQGGLTTKTDLNDVMVRSDLAIAALKAKQNDKAREYLAMTGEGRLPDGPFALPADTNVPPCGGDIRPDDVVVVEFGIGDDGHVTFANPVYASRQGPIATEFARAVSNWSWQAGDVKKIPIFYRAVTRIELRCSAGIDRPDETVLLAPAFDKWLFDKNLPTPSDSERNDARLLRAEIEKRDAGALDRLPYLVALASRREVETKDRKEAWDQAIAIADGARAPVPVSVYLRVMRLGEEVRTSRQGLSVYRAGLRALLARPEVTADARSAGVVRLLLAAPALGSAPSDAAELLQQVAEDKRLDAHDPLRVGALVRLSSVQVQKGDVAAARATYLQSGLSAQQCALVDAQPAMRRAGVSSNDYPNDAYMWGIGGWTQIEFDVLPDGRTANRRAIMSYPPFTFGDSTAKAMEAARYTQTYRPDGAIGCSGAKLRVRYAMPGH